MRVVWSPLAMGRAVEAAEYIADDGPDSAARWIRGLFEAVKRLRDFPRSSRTVAEIGREDIREILYRDYRVIYRVAARQVGILTVRHGRRKFDSRELEDS